MTRPLPALALSVALAGAAPHFLLRPDAGGGGSPSPLSGLEDEGPSRAPSDWFLLQRAWPQDDIDQSARLDAYAAAARLRSAARGGSGGAWQLVGPTNVGGRIADVSCHPTDANVVYIGSASGGVLKSTDAGLTWTALFDEESALSIGSVAVAASAPDVVWVGTGEPNGGGGSVTYGGTGVFRSTDAGATWESRGLAETRTIGRVAVDPAEPSRVFVAALGSFWSPSPHRGVYRTTDAGDTWERVLASTDSTGAVDLVLHPTNPDIVYAALWECARRPGNIDYGGVTSGIHRSTDGGDTWTELTAGLPGGDRGRIGLTLCNAAPSVLYAIYAESNPGSFEGVYKSTNGGDSWSATSDGALSGVYATYGWWFGNIRVAPNDANRVYVLGYEFWRTTNGGSSWSDVGSSMHVDHHGLDFAADGRLFEGNDGGMYRSQNGTSWTKLPALPVSQFYAIEVNEQIPTQRYGGLQDNGTCRTMTGGSSDWAEILGGDGFRPLVDPTNAQYVYAEYQYGALHRSTNGGSSMSSIGSPLAGRKNWSMPVEFDPADPARLFAGSHLVYRSVNRGTSWTAISPDLTDGSGGGSVVFGTITTLAVAPTDANVILAGTDDANVWITTNGGGAWTRVDAAIPERWITRVAFDPTDDAIGFVTVSGFRWDEPQPHVFRTTNHGASWTDISGNLPEAPVNDLVVDPETPSSVFYVATDFGVFATTNGGASWEALGEGLPNVVVADLELHAPTRTLVAGTYGRSMWTYDLQSAVDAPPPSLAAATGGPQLLPPRPNPAREVASIRWSMEREGRVDVSIVDVSGRRVATLARGAAPAGPGSALWNRRGDDGRRVAPGVYFVRLAADGLVRTRKITVAE